MHQFAPTGCGRLAEDVFGDRRKTRVLCGITSPAEATRPQERGPHLQGDDSCLLLLEVGACQVAPHAALDDEGRLVHHLCAQLVQLSHLPSPQEYLPPAAPSQYPTIHLGVTGGAKPLPPRGVPAM